VNVTKNRMEKATAIEMKTAGEPVGAESRRFGAFPGRTERSDTEREFALNKGRSMDIYCIAAKQLELCSSWVQRCSSVHTSLKRVRLNGRGNDDSSYLKRLRIY
jgi:hypothetical protein